MKCGDLNYASNLLSIIIDYIKGNIMKFRYYSDEFVYFNILGQDTSNGIINLGINEIFDSLKDCINYLYSHPKIYKILLNNKQYQL